MTSKDNKIIQSLWIRGELSNNELLSIRSYLYHEHDFHLYTYEVPKNVPPKTIIKDANEIIPRTKIFKDSENSPAGFSDWFRFKLLYEKGGWWVDLDTVCLRPFDIENKYCFSTEVDALGPVLVNATYIKSRAKAGFLKECLEFIEKKEIKDIRFGEFGLTLYRKILLKYEIVDFIKSPEAFCPINWFDLSNLLTQYDYTPSENTYAIHLWNHIWKRGCLNKNATYHPQSIYERLKRKYL